MTCDDDMDSKQPEGYYAECNTTTEQQTVDANQNDVDDIDGKQPEGHYEECNTPTEQETLDNPMYDDHHQTVPANSSSHGTNTQGSGALETYSNIDSDIHKVQMGKL